jgi:hypothetical protein
VLVGRRELRLRAFPAPTVGGVANPQEMGLADEIRELKLLHAEGTLTDQEFTDAKAAVTQQAASGAAPPSSSGGKKVI